VRSPEERSEAWEEFPDRVAWWNSWNESLWGGRLPGREALEGADRHRRSMASDVASVPWPADELLETAARERGPVALADGQPIPVWETANPRPKASFGFASIAFDIDLEPALGPPADVVVPIDPDQTEHVVRSTIRLFWWNEGMETFDLVPMSGYDGAREVAWGRVRERGTYVGIGYPRDPRIRLTVQLFTLLAPYRRLGAGMGLTDWMPLRICELILCAPDVFEPAVDEIWDDWKVVATGAPVQGFGRPGADGPHGRPGGEPRGDL